MRWGRFEWGFAALLVAAFLAWMALLAWGGERLVSWAVAP